jgi:transposase
MKIIKKIRDWFWKLAIAYHEYKAKNYQRQNCSRCGARHLFDVPIGVPIECIEFVCTKCCKKSEPFTIEITNESPIEVPCQPFQEQTCEHPQRSREYYESGLFKCWGCGKILNSTTK